MFFIAIAFQSSNKKRILDLQGISAGVFAIHFILLGAYSGAGMNAVEVIRNLIFRKVESTKRKMIFVVAFSLIFITVGFLTWQGPWSLLPIIAQVQATAAVSLKKPKYIRLCFIPVFTLWLIYNSISLSIAGILTEIFDLGTILFAIWRLDIRGKRNERNADYVL